MARRDVPSGWPAPHEVADQLRGSGLPATDGAVEHASVLSVRSWSVVYAVRLRGPDGATDLVVKCIREPHHVRPAQGEDFTARSNLELRTLELAAMHGIPMPRPIGALHSIGAIVMERVPERHLRQLGRWAEWRVPMQRVGSLCRRWHDIDEIPPGADRHTAGEVLANVCSKITSPDRPHVWPLSNQEWSRLLETFTEQCDDTVVATHGDLHAGNVWLDCDGQPFFVDAAITCAHPVADIARLAASLRAPARRHPLTSASVIDPAIEALRFGFGPHSAAMFALHELDNVLTQWVSHRHRRRGWDSDARRSARVVAVDQVFSVLVRRWYGRYLAEIR